MPEGGAACSPLLLASSYWAGGAQAEPQLLLLAGWGLGASQSVVPQFERGGSIFPERRDFSSQPGLWG